MDTRRINVAIVGCGKIGTQWDTPASPSSPKTHAAAFTRNSGSRLVAVCDRDASAAHEAGRRWNCRSYQNANDMLDHEDVDLLVVATSTASRLQLIEMASSAGIRFFVIEKPLASSANEARRIAATLKRCGARALVNFSRRWDPAICDLRDQLAAGRLGRLQRFVGFYGKGIGNNGSHMIDLVAMLCAADPVRVRSLGSPLPPGEAAWSADGDRTLDAQVVMVGADGVEYQLDLLGTDQSAFTCFELRVVGESGVCNITAGGRVVDVANIIDDPVFANYRILGAPTYNPSRGLESMERMAIEAIALAAGRVEKASCDVATALTTAVTVEAIARSEIELGRWIQVQIRPSDGQQETRNDV